MAEVNLEAKLNKLADVMERFMTASIQRFDRQDHSTERLGEVCLGLSTELGRMLEVMQEGFDRQGQHIIRQGEQIIQQGQHIVELSQQIARQEQQIAIQGQQILQQGQQIQQLIEIAERLEMLIENIVRRWPINENQDGSESSDGEE